MRAIWKLSRGSSTVNKSVEIERLQQEVLSAKADCAQHQKQVQELSARLAVELATKAEFEALHNGVKARLDASLRDQRFLKREISSLKTEIDQHNVLKVGDKKQPRSLKKGVSWISDSSFRVQIIEDTESTRKRPTYLMTSVSGIVIPEASCFYVLTRTFGSGAAP